MSERELKQNEVRLKDGRILEIKELSALEDSVAYRMAAPELVKEDNQIISGMTVRAAQIALSIAKVDGEDFKPVRELQDVFNLQAKYGKKAWAKISDKYFEINEADDEGE